MARQLLDKVVFPFGSAEIYPNFIIMVMNEGVHVIPEYNDDLIRLSEKYYKDKRFVYITNRKNSYSVDPRIYMETSKIKNLAGFAIVSEKEIPVSTAQVEQIFLKKPMEVFNSLDQAEEWANGLLR